MFTARSLHQQQGPHHDPYQGARHLIGFKWQPMFTPNSRMHSLGSYLQFLAQRGELVRIREPVATTLDITEIQRRVLATAGPALLFEQPLLPDGSISRLPLVCNLFGTRQRVTWGLSPDEESLASIGARLAMLRQPEAGASLSETLRTAPIRHLLAMRPRLLRQAPVQQQVWRDADINLQALPVMQCWPDEPAPLITWPLVITRPPDDSRSGRYNLGVYRMQVLGPQQALVRWLAHRGGAEHFRQWQQLGQDMPMAVAIGADPGTLLAAVTPVPENLSEYHYAGLLRRQRLDLVPAQTVPLLVPAQAEIILEGYVSATDTAPEGPYGDHTGYYNDVAPFPIFNLTAITMRRQAVYLSTFTGRAPDEPAVIGEVLNELALPLLQKQFPEVTDFWLPPEACSYRVAVVAIKKRYPGQARRLMLGLWSWLPQFSYTKLLILVDDDINCRHWPDVIWALATRMDASRDLLVLDNTPIDYLDFASPRSGLGGKLGLDATRKLGPETDRPWGRTLAMDAATRQRVDALWPTLGLPT